MTSDLDTFRKIAEHIALVQRLLLSAQIELARRIVTHDRTKLSSPEWEMYREAIPDLERLTYGSEEYKAIVKQMQAGPLKHHFEHNRHHSEHFENGIDEMNLFDVLEMLIDWIAHSKLRAGGDMAKSIEINCDRFGVSAQLKQIIENTVPWIEDEFADLKTQADLKQSRCLE